ncbi:hypothetical protein JHK82_012269 [Glycine max]|nr:hypothetical protein JHK87_012173 [Glycine soja]KAG5040137.1 hypothetical protein JHK85_012613 [Glycine max]KAG5057278.1 hypothetical protein JHK86_012274 [Glycine max]KAG5154300.1 hypothetical protein JHK82_012269 [Glycine max]
MIGRPGAWEEGGVLRGKKDAVTALCLIVREEGTTTARYALCSMTKDNKVRAGVMRALMELMVDLGSSISYLVSLVVVAVAEGRVALVEEGGLPVLVEIVEVLNGQLFVDQYCEKEQISFIDYISSDLELHFMVAVDFTGASEAVGVEGIMEAYASALHSVTL